MDRSRIGRRWTLPMSAGIGTISTTGTANTGRVALSASPRGRRAKPPATMSTTDSGSARCTTPVKSRDGSGGGERPNRSANCARPEDHYEQASARATGPTACAGRKAQPQRPAHSVIRTTQPARPARNVGISAALEGQHYGQRPARASRFWSARASRFWRAFEFRFHSTLAAFTPRFISASSF